MTLAETTQQIGPEGERARAAGMIPGRRASLDLQARHRGAGGLESGQCIGLCVEHIDVARGGIYVSTLSLARTHAGHDAALMPGTVA